MVNPDAYQDRHDKRGHHTRRTGSDGGYIWSGESSRKQKQSETKQSETENPSRLTMSSHTSSISLETTPVTHHHPIYDSKEAEANIAPANVDFSKESDDFEVVRPQQEYAAEAADAHHGELHRAFKARHIQMIGLGGNVGSGLFISTGKALRYGSAPGMLIGYPLIASMVCDARPDEVMASLMCELSCLRCCKPWPKRLAFFQPPDLSSTMLLASWIRRWALQSGFSNGSEPWPPSPRKPRFGLSSSVIGRPASRPLLVWPSTLRSSSSSYACRWDGTPNGNSPQGLQK